ncbi:MAG: hypothetical protein IJ775_05450 [Muribaculaceae bacterium]|nr:hypothetical protein [Muribaculaceae bacterium]
MKIFDYLFCSVYKKQLKNDSSWVGIVVACLPLTLTIYTLFASTIGILHLFGIELRNLTFFSGSEISKVINLMAIVIPYIIFYIYYKNNYRRAEAMAWYEQIRIRLHPVFVIIVYIIIGSLGAFAAAFKDIL